MDQQFADVILSLTNPLHRLFVKWMLKSQSEFAARFDSLDRATAKACRPNFMHSRFLHYSEMEFGRRGSPCIVEDYDLRFLRIESDAVSIGIRNKKLDQQFRSHNHRSDNQDAIQQQGMFPGHAYQLFIGYRDSDALIPSITHILLTFERNHVVHWRHFLWTAKEKLNPTQEIYAPLILPPAPQDTAPEPDVRPKPQKSEPKRRRHANSGRGQAGESAG